MPVYTKINGETTRSYSEDARFVDVTEQGFHRELLAVGSSARTLIEMGEAVAEDGDTFNLDSDLRKAIADAQSALTDLYASLPMPKVRAAA